VTPDPSGVERSEHSEAADSSDGLDLTPRDVAPRSGSRLVPMLIVGVICVALVAVLFQTLGNASLSFTNVDEAVERRAEFGESRFLLQGTPIDRASTVTGIATGAAAVADSPSVVFAVAFEGVTANVVHEGNPAETFQPGVPVVLEGHWAADADDEVFEAMVSEGLNPNPDGWYFRSSRMMVKHDNEYRVDNDERLRDAERGGMLPATGTE